VTVRTDHTSGSPWDAAADPATLFRFETPVFCPPPVDLVGDRSGADAAGHANLAATGPAACDPDPLAETASSEAGAAAIEFRVIRPGAPLRRLRLTGNRYTFGSAEGCSIRLNDPALRPMHAVLIREVERILIRAYSVPIQVNGMRTTEATLRVGDVMRLGVYQFELLSSAKPLDPIVSTAPRASATEAAPSESSSTAAKAGSSLPSTEDVMWRERLRREIEEWRDRQIECDRRESRCDGREADLRGRESELWTRAENLYRRESRLQSQETAAFQLYDEFNQRQQELLRLRDDAQQRQHALQQREAEFREQEFEYRRKLEEATRQLRQSQQQAESATQAVGRMREQFESLQHQIEELSGEHQQIERREREQREQHHRLRLELEQARDAAIEARAESELHRQQAEARVEQMAAQIQAFQQDQGSDLQEQLAKLQASERAADQLRGQVAELQQTIAQASQESSRLRREYEQALDSVRQLESLVSQSQQRSEQDRESWTAEADELRTAVDRLSLELARANSDLGNLRDANRQLSQRLDQMQQERDAARAEADARPTSEAFESLRGQLDTAQVQLADVTRHHQQTLELLEQAQQSVARAAVPASGRGAEAEPRWQAAAWSNPADSDDTTNDVRSNLPAEDASAGQEAAKDQPSHGADLLRQVDAPAPPWSEQYSPTAVWGQSEVLSVEVADLSGAGLSAASGLDNGSLWPEEAESIPWGVAPQGDQAVAEPSQDAWSQAAVSFPAAPSGQEQGEVEAGEADLESDRDVAISRVMTALWNNSAAAIESELGLAPWADAAHFAGGHPPDRSQDADDAAHAAQADEHRGGDHSPLVEGSLASMLIRDIEAEQAMYHEHDGTYLMDAGLRPQGWDSVGPADQQPKSWDREFGEESRPSRWSNDPRGYRVEEVEPSGVFEDAQIADDGDPADLSPVLGELAEPLPGQLEPQPSAETVVEGGEDESIEAYMNRLLRRVQGEPVSKTTPESVSVSGTSRTRTATQLDGLTVSKTSRDTIPQPIDPTAPMVPRSQAPERAGNLSAMRELANATARSAISQSLRQQTRHTQIQGLVSFGCAGGALLCGLLLYLFVPGVVPNVVRLVAVAMTVVVAAIYGREGIGSFREAHQRLKAIEGGQPDPAEGSDRALNKADAESVSRR
jgi:hypothetical protein